MTLPREPLKTPVELLPAYESLPHLVRRIVRDEIAPLMELSEEIRNLLVGHQGGGHGQHQGNRSGVA